MTARQFAKHRETFCLASAGSDEEFRAYLSGFDAAVAIADLAAVPAQVRVKPLVWISTGENRYSAKSEDYKVVTDGKCWAFCPEDWPPFAGYPYLTADAAKAAAQDDYEARILAALETMPDPRDAMIARLVDVLGDAVKWTARYQWAAPWGDDASAALAAVKGGVE